MAAKRGATTSFLRRAVIFQRPKVAFRVLNFEANLAKVILGFVILESRADLLQRKTPIDNGLEPVSRYRANHVLLIGAAADGDAADPDLIRKQCWDRHFARKTGQD